MSITKEEVKKIAKLSRIRLSDEEVNLFGEELSSILNWAQMLQEVDTDNVEQMSSTKEGMILPMREDVINDGNVQGDVLKNAPSAEYSFYKVPKVVE